jgi:hypothetical protein
MHILIGRRPSFRAVFDDHPPACNCQSHRQARAYWLTVIVLLFHLDFLTLDQIHLTRLTSEIV